MLQIVLARCSNESPCSPTIVTLNINITIYKEIQETDTILTPILYHYRSLVGGGVWIGIAHVIPVDPSYWRFAFKGLINSKR